MNIDHLVNSYGYWAVLLLVGVESLGVPVPGETALVFAGTIAGKYHHLNPWGILAAAIAGAVAGDNIGYWIGDKGGFGLLKRYGRYVRIDEAKLKVGRYIFERHGGKVVFFGRFVSVLRTYAAFLAGTNKMKWRRFVIYNIAGGVIWSSVYTWAAYFAGNTIRKASGTLSIALGIAVAVVILAAIILTRHQIRRLEDRAAEAYPGPLT